MFGGNSTTKQSFIVILLQIDQCEGWCSICCQTNASNKVWVNYYTRNLTVFNHVIAISKQKKIIKPLICGYKWKLPLQCYVFAENSFNSLRFLIPSKCWRRNIFCFLTNSALALVIESRINIWNALSRIPVNGENKIIANTITKQTFMFIKKRKPLSRWAIGKL